MSAGIVPVREFSVRARVSMKKTQTAMSRSFVMSINVCVCQSPIKAYLDW